MDDEKQDKEPTLFNDECPFCEDVFKRRMNCEECWGTGKNLTDLGQEVMLLVMRHLETR